VQAGAFREQENAQDLQARLENYFTHVRIRSEDNLYRVLLGPYKKRKEAERIRNELADLGVTAYVRAGG
jgi:cell division protein FtsN